MADGRLRGLVAFHRFQSPFSFERERSKYTSPLNVVNIHLRQNLSGRLDFIRRELLPHSPNQLFRLDVRTTFPASHTLAGALLVKTD